MLREFRPAFESLRPCNNELSAGKRAFSRITFAAEQFAARELVDLSDPPFDHYGKPRCDRSSGELDETLNPFFSPFVDGTRLTRFARFEQVFCDPLVLLNIG